MGIKYKIINELENANDGLTVKELARLLNKTKPVIRTILHRDLRPNFVIEKEKNGMIIKRDGGKVFILAKDKNGNVKDTKYLRKLHTIMVEKMKPAKKLTPDEIKDLTEIESILGIKP